MSCNGCRALRKGCSDGCILRQGLQAIPTPQAQSHATVFLARFFGRSDLIALIAGVPQHHRSSLFQSLLYEACGRTVNPVSGAVGLLWSGNWHLCQAAVDTVLAGGTLSPIPSAVVIAPPEASDEACGVSSGLRFSSKIRGGREGTRKWSSARKDQNMTTASSGKTGGDDRVKLLNLFV